MKNSMTYILGINCVYHESSVALLRVDATGLQLVAFAEEERFNRIKRAKPALIDNSDKLPLKSLQWALDHARIGLQDVAHIATSMNPDKRRRENMLHPHRYEVPAGDFGTPEGEQLFYQKVRNIEPKVRELGFNGQFHFLDHHACHSASSFYVSGYSDAVSVVVDGIGEFESISIYDCENQRQRLAYTLDYPNSLGFLWEKISEFVGFSVYDAGKTMGMSAFGGRRILEGQFAKFATLTDDLFRLDDSIIQFRNGNFDKLEKALGLPRSKQPIAELNYNTLIYFDLAATLQDFTEKAVLKLVEKAKQMTGKSRLCLSGGVALNCVANQKVLEAGLFEEVYIQPASNDAGTALGAGLAIAHQFAPSAKDFKLRSPYSAVAFGEDSLRSVLETNDAITFKRSDDIYAETAQLIADGGIIAWFQGGMEYGPRALGHRSIIADPRDIHTLGKINEHVKLREIFRPLAPAVLKEKAQEWFEIENKWIHQDNSPYLYMLATTQVKTDKKHCIPSVVHYDDTARVQIVDKEISPRFYQLIEAFDKITGVPILTNTSFNIQEPIVCTPQDALKTFLRSSMAALVMGDYIIQRKKTPVVKAGPQAEFHAYEATQASSNGHEKIKQTLFFVEGTAEGRFAITYDTTVYNWQDIPPIIQSRCNTEGFCLPVVTDPFEYQGKDQVIPLQPEQIFFMDYLQPETVRNSHFLEIGLGSGVLSLFCLMRGAEKGVGLEINPRAKLFSEFNATMNELEGQMEIRDGDTTNVFAPVAGEQYDLIISNPPFEPTPPDMDYYFNSAAGIYGLDFVEALLEGVDQHLKDNGLFQMVTMAPGNEEGPFMLYDLIEKHLPGEAVEVILDQQPIRYNDFVDRFVDLFHQDTNAIQQMKQTAQSDGVTHLHMLLLRYTKGQPGGLQVKQANSVYETWSSPLGAAMPITEVMF